MPNLTGELKKDL